MFLILTVDSSGLRHASWGYWLILAQSGNGQESILDCMNVGTLRYTEALVRSIYLFHSPHSNVRTFIPGTIDMCSRAKVTSFSTGHLHIPIQVIASILSSCICFEIRTASVSIIDYLLHMFSISPPLFLLELSVAPRLSIFRLTASTWVSRLQLQLTQLI